MLSDEDIILRLVWHPIHFKDGVVLASAFSKDDITRRPDQTGNSRFLSVDDKALIERNCIDWRINWQQRDGRDVTQQRHFAKFVEYQCGDLRRLSWPLGAQMFEIRRHPSPQGADGPGSPENPAHCGIHSENLDDLTEDERRGYVAEMRAKLVRTRRSILEYDDIFG